MAKNLNTSEPPRKREQPFTIPSGRDGKGAVLPPFSKCPDAPYPKGAGGERPNYYGTTQWRAPK